MLTLRHRSPESQATPLAIDQHPCMGRHLTLRFLSRRLSLNPPVQDSVLGKACTPCSHRQPLRTIIRHRKKKKKKTRLKKLRNVPSSTDFSGST